MFIYGFVDASSTGYGSSFLLPDGNVHFRYGLWGRDEGSGSSNFRELSNLVVALEDGVAQGYLTHTEVFIYTDNTTAKRANYKGKSPSCKLFELVLRLRTLEINALLQLHVIHVAGTCMIVQGTDGLSWGLLTEGVFAASPAWWTVPLHLCAINRSATLLPCLHPWSPQPL